MQYISFKTLIWLSFFVLIGNFSYASEHPDSQQTKNSEVSFQPQVEPVLNVPKFKNGIKIDGNLTEPQWQKATVATNFAEFFPGDEVQPPVKTEVRLFYDQQNMYVGFLAYDKQPSQIRASMQDRDNVFNDDNIGIILDTYGNANWAYEIFSNPFGIQGDLLRAGNQEDGSFDLIFHSAGKITKKGYQVEIAIPFTSLRFPDKPEQTWRATFVRNHPRNSRRQYSWATVDRDNPCLLCQLGTLKGIRNVHPGRNLELLPSVVGSQSGELSNPADPNSDFENADPSGEFSLGAEYGFSPSTTFEATYNPDFSQVESDAAQIDVNTTFALFFPEKRPFFQEGSDLWDSFFNIFYTRSINDPIGAAKFTGRLGRWNVAYLIARDEQTPIILPFEEKSELVAAGKSVSNIFRVQRTILEDSYIGGIFTDRRLTKNGNNSVGGFDGSLRFFKNYRFEFQVLASKTHEPNDTTITENLNNFTFDKEKHTAGFDGEDFWGSAYLANLEREARIWNADLTYSEKSPTFRADNGFIGRNNTRHLSYWNGWFFRPNTKLLDRITPSFSVGRIWNSEWTQKDEWFRPELDIDFKTQTNVEFAYVWSKERFRDIVFDGIKRFEFEFRTKFSEFIQFDFEYENGRNIARNLETPVLGSGYEFEAGAFIKPFNRLVIEPELTYAKLDHPDDGSTIFEGYIFRSRINYQFTREFFLRLIVQYDKFDKQLSIEPLLTYRLNPFSLFYVGSTHGYRDFDEISGFNRTSRQFFLKFQYLFQL